MSLLDQFHQQAKLEKETLLQRINQLLEALQSEIIECGLPYCLPENDKENLPYQVKLVEDELSGVSLVNLRFLSFLSSIFS